MARRMRQFDWSMTPLGPVERWPQPFRTSVSTSLNCAFPIVLWWGPELTLLYNDEYRAMLGPGKHPWALGKPGELVWSEIWDVVGPMLRHVMETGEATRSRDLLLHINRGYSEEAYFSFSYSPIFDDCGKVGGIFCPVIETTDRVIGERRLRLARDQADTASRLKDEFLAVLSHELRTPLNSILLWSSEVRRDLKVSPERLSHALDVIERNARVQAQLTEDLLDLSTIISGKLQLHPADADLTVAVSAAVDAVRPAARAKDLAVQVLLPDKLGAHVDAARIQQVVWNLVSNAVKFTPAGGGAIKVRLRRNESNAEIRISDAGRGIQADFLPHVFERFTQADSTASRRNGGLGLGLALVRELVEAHGGSVNVESDGEGRGATFTVLLPVREKATGDAPPSSSATDGRSAKAVVSHSLSGISVLVVDDDPDTRELLALTLKRYGASVTTVKSAGEALSSIRRRRHDVLVADIGLPGVDGYSLIRRMRAKEKNSRRKLPAVALTAYASLSDRQRAIAAGYNGHLTKPVEPEALVQSISALVGTRK
jgi:signal transduction histidine kinase/ActR/RegA family two-component response regulator